MCYADPLPAGLCLSIHVLRQEGEYVHLIGHDSLVSLFGLAFIIKGYMATPPDKIHAFIVRLFGLTPPASPPLPHRVQGWKKKQVISKKQTNSLNF